jgi:hypothetical protein
MSVVETIGSRVAQLLCATTGTVAIIVGTLILAGSASAWLNQPSTPPAAQVGSLACGSGEARYAAYVQESNQFYWACDAGTQGVQ